MPKRKTPLQRLAEAVAEVGIEKAVEHFEFLKAMKKPEPKTRKKATGIFLTTNSDSTGETPPRVSERQGKGETR